MEKSQTWEEAACLRQPTNLGLRIAGLDETPGVAGQSLGLTGAEVRAYLLYFEDKRLARVLRLALQRHPIARLNA